jgi:hypothetical protein
MTKQKNADGTDVVDSSKEVDATKEAVVTDTTDATKDATKEATDTVADNKADEDEDKDLGFPKDTPLAEMEAPEREAYWKHHSKKHESAKKNLERVLDGLKPEDVTELKEIKGKYDALVANSTTDQTELANAVAAAKEDGIKEERARVAPYLLDLEIKSVLGDRYDAERMKTVLGKVKTSDFFTATGDVDTESVKGYFDILFPAAVAPVAPVKKTREIHGGHTSTKDTSSGGSAGKSLYEQMKGRSAT